MAAETIRVYSGRGAVTQLMLGIVCAAIYGVALWATSFLPTIPGVTWLRPANMLSELFAVNFGWIGALGVAFGNSLSDLLRGQFNPTILWWVFPLEFIATAMVVYWGVTWTRATCHRRSWPSCAAELQAKNRRDSAGADRGLALEVLDRRLGAARYPTPVSAG